jgi:predicted ATPase
VIQQLTFTAGIGAGDSNDEKLDKLETLLVDGNAPPIGALLGLATEERYGPMNLAPQQQRAQTLQALAGQLIGLSRDEPVLFVLEDAHWIDATTLELVDLCLDQVTDARVLMLITARPAFEHGFGDHPAVSRLALNRLGRAQVIAIVSKLTGGRRLPEELLKVIVTQTDGVPLFVEELTKSVLESGQLEASEEGFKLNGPLSRLAIPATLHDSLMARLDRLPPVKEVAQMAACIGREFDYQLLKAISALDDLELRGALDQLISAELIFRRGLAGDATYIFKHALVRDAAYESLLKARRQVIHERLVEVLEAGGGVRPEILAYHATQAGRLEAAIGHWEAAGNAAMAQPAYQEAITHYRSAIDLMEHMEDQKAWAERELTIQLRLAQALIAKQGHGAAATAEAFARASVLIEETGNADLRVPVYYGIWVGHYLRGEHEKNFRTASELTRQVDQRDEIVPRLIAHRLFGTTLVALGRLDEARRHLETSFGLYLPAEHEDLANQFGQDPAIAARTYLTFDMWLLGYVDQAAGHAAAIEEAADRLAHVNTVCWVAMHLATYALYARNDELLRTSVARLDAVSSQHGMRLWQNYCEFSKGLMQSRAGDPSGLERFEKAFDEYVSNGHWLFMPIFKVEQASELHRLGRNRDALLVLQEAKNIIEATGECWAQAELCRVEGEVEAALSRQGEVETAFRRALEISRAKGAKSWELRAATSLARLWAKRGDRQAGLDLLQPVHAWFTEGHDTPDLKDAKALLDQLC